MRNMLIEKTLRPFRARTSASNPICGTNLTYPLDINELMHYGTCPLDLRLLTVFSLVSLATSSR
jgi:hypothetical protein